jgi:O-antigen ligase
MLLNRISGYHWKLVQFILLFFAFSLPFSINFSNILLVVLATLLLLRKDIVQRIWTIRHNPYILSYLALFGLYALSMLWSDNSRVAGFTLEKHLALLIIPVTFFANYDKFSSKLVKWVLFAFVLGVFASYAYLAFKFGLSSVSNPNLTLFYFFREMTVQYVQLHPTYLAMYTVFSVCILLASLYKKNLGIQMLLRVLGVFILIGLTLLTGARMPIIALVLILLVLVIYIIFNSKYWVFSSIGSVIFFAGLIFLIPKVKVVKERISELQETELAPPIGVHFNSVNLRVAQLLCSKQLIQENWLIGVGIGDVQDQLNGCYSGHKWSPALYERSYNTHNQYLQTFLSTGIIGFVLLLVLFGMVLRFSIKSKNIIFASFIILFSFCCLTESMFEKNKGIVFFTFFSVVLMADSGSRKISAKPKKNQN